MSGALECGNTKHRRHSVLLDAAAVRAFLKTGKWRYGNYKRKEQTGPMSSSKSPSFGEKYMRTPRHDSELENHYWIILTYKYTMYSPTMSIRGTFLSITGPHR